MRWVDSYTWSLFENDGFALVGARVGEVFSYGKAMLLTRLKIRSRNIGIEMSSVSAMAVCPYIE